MATVSGTYQRCWNITIGSRSRSFALVKSFAPLL